MIERPLSPAVVVAFTVVFCALFATAATAQVDARMFRYPDVSEDLITFVYAGDIWVADKRGGAARRLSSPPGEESFPRFSPDGSLIAFSGNYDGNTDVYVVPAAGGDTVRITHHPGADRLVDWTPDGSALIFASNRKSGSTRFNQLYRVSADGGLPEKLPVAYGEFGALSDDGRRLAYTPKSRGFRTWKRYRGGMAPEVWLLDLDTLEATNLSDSDANDMQPMWRGETVYFLSDRDENQRGNIWAYELNGNRLRQVTDFVQFDITWPAIGPSDMVFQAGGRLYVMDLETEQYAEVSIGMVTDRATVRPRNVNVGSSITNAGISPSGGIFPEPFERDVLTYSGKLLAEAHAHNPNSPFRSYTLYSTIFGKAGETSNGVPSPDAAEAYVREFPQGPFIVDVHLVAAHFYDDVYKLITLEEAGQRIGYKFDCYDTYLKAQPT